MNPGPKRTPHPPPLIPDHELVRHIGSGSFGEVWLARNLMRTWRAVKIVWRDNFATDADYSRERAGVTKFEPLSRKHEGMVDVLHMGVLADPVCFFYVMEVADDEREGAGFVDPATYSPRTFESIVARRERLSFDRCLDLGVGLAAALQFLHSRGLVHRDVKPSSIIIVDEIAKLADIGLVTDTGGAKTLVGTDGYIPPEGPGSPQADLYALGKVIYELAFGLDRKQFPELPQALAFEPEGSQLLELNDLLIRACASKSIERYQNAGELLADLRILRSGRSVRRIRKLERRLRWARSALVTVVILGASVFLMQHLRNLVVARRELVEQVTADMLRARVPGWRDEVLRLIPSGGGVDSKLRDLAAANLRGMDARNILLWTNSPSDTVAFDADSKRLAVGGKDLVTQVVPLSAKGPASKGPTGALALTFDRDDQLVELRVGKEGNLEIHRDRENLHKIRLDWPAFGTTTTMAATGEEDAPSALSADGKTAIALKGGQLVVWNTVSGAIRYAEECTGTAVAVTPDGSWLAVAHDNGDIRLHELSGHREVTLPSSNHARINCLRFGRDFVRREEITEELWLLAAGDSGGCVTVWDASRRTARNVLRGSGYDIYTLAFNPDSTLLASAGRGEIRLWDVAIGQLVLALPVGDFFSSVCFSPDGRRLAAASRDRFWPGEVQVWELEAGRGIHVLRGLGGRVTKLAVSPDDRFLAAVSHDWQIGVWELDSGKLCFVREVPRGVLADNSALAFSPDDHQLAFEAGRSVRLFDVRSGAQMWATNLPSGLIDALRYDPVGRLLSFRQENEGSPTEPMFVGRMRDLLATDPLSSLFEIRDPNLWLTDAAFAPDGKTLAVAGRVKKGQVAAVMYSTITGTETWRISCTESEPSAGLAFDTSGEIISVAFYRSKNAAYQVADGIERSDVKISSSAMARGGRLAARPGQPQSEFGWSLFEDGRWDATLGIDQLPAGFPCFDHAGTAFIWANRDGSLNVGNINSIRKELARLGSR